MNSASEKKDLVRDRYGRIATQDKAQNAASCCGATPSSGKVYSIMMDDYSGLEGYVPEADLGLGCGLPTEFADIQTGDTVLDLGSGAGNDCFVARQITGPEGKVIGVDFTPEMLWIARQNAVKMNYANVEFREGDIEELPVVSDSVDVVVSNCVLNLVPDKARVLAEIFRVLKPGGHFSISDVVRVGDLPEALQKDAEMYAGCVSGSILRDDYLQLMAEAGFVSIHIQKTKPIHIPDDVLGLYLSQSELNAFRQGETGIFSITVRADKPSQAPSSKPRIRLSSLGTPACNPATNCC